jgi:hypothetical protein
MRREQGRRVRERLEEVRVASGVAQVEEQKRQAVREYQELQARKRHEFVEWRYRTQQELRAQLDRSLHAERAELRRLRRQRKQLEAVA